MFGVSPKTLLVMALVSFATLAIVNRVAPLRSAAGN